MTANRRVPPTCQGPARNDGHSVRTDSVRCIRCRCAERLSWSWYGRLVKPPNLRRDLPIPRDLSCRVLRTGEAEIALLTFTPAGSSQLTAAEKDIALAVARGWSNAEIAAARHSSTRTVANQLAGILKKLGVSSRVELVATFDVQAFR